jgi:hypothetical protein
MYAGGTKKEVTILTVLTELEDSSLMNFCGDPKRPIYRK